MSQDNEPTNGCHHACSYRGLDNDHSRFVGSLTYEPNEDLSSGSMSIEAFPDLHMPDNIPSYTGLDSTGFLNLEAQYQSMGTSFGPRNSSTTSGSRSSSVVFPRGSVNHPNVSNSIELRQLGFATDTKDLPSTTGSSPTDVRVSARNHVPNYAGVSALEVMQACMGSTNGNSNTKASYGSNNSVIQRNDWSVNRFLPSVCGPKKADDWAPPLHIAAEKGHEAIIRVLLDTNDIDINERDSKGAAALHLAVRHENNTIVKLLIESGADINATDPSDWTPVHEAAEVGNAVAMKMLLTHGATMSSKAKRR